MEKFILRQFSSYKDYWKNNGWSKRIFMTYFSLVCLFVVYPMLYLAGFISGILTFNNPHALAMEVLESVA